MSDPITLRALSASTPGPEALAGRSIEVWPDRVYTVHTRAFELGRANLDRSGAAFAAHLPVGPVLLLQDDNTRAVAGDEVARSLTAAGFTVHPYTLEGPAGEHIEATGERVDEVIQAVDAIGDAVAAIAVGSGTINDLVKYASFQRQIPYGVCATAASMNGYTSAIAAILEDGIKRTLGCLPPVVVVADLDIVAAAPAALTLAGLGDLLSKPVSSGDWRLGHLLLGEAFTEVPLVLVEAAFRKVQAAARGIGEGSPAAVGALLEALLLSGISMASAGTSSPASGGEHLISHYWDMVAPFRGRHVGLHGAQVGVTTLISATLYQHLMARRPTEADIERRLAALPAAEDYIEALSACPEPLRPGIRAEVLKKFPTREVLGARLRALAQGWDHIWGEVGKNLQTPETLRSVLEAAGAPVSASALGIPEWELREAFLRARDIRARYTILDLAWEMGALEELEEPVLQASGVLG